MYNDSLVSQIAGGKKFTYSLFVISGAFTLSSFIIFGFIIAKLLDPKFSYLMAGSLAIAVIISIVGIYIKPYEKGVAEVAQDQMKEIKRMNRGPEDDLQDKIDNLYSKFKMSQEEEED